MAWAPDYITLDQLKDFLRIPLADLDDDVFLAAYIGTASRAIDNECNRQFGKVDAPEERVYTQWWYDGERGRWVIDIDDLMSTVGVTATIDGVALAPADYHLEPRIAVQEGKPWTRLAVRRDSAVQPTGVEPELAMTAPWGWTTVPDGAVESAYLQSSRFSSRRGSPYGVAGSPEQGSELRLLARVDPDVAVSLRGLKRPRKVG